MALPGACQQDTLYHGFRSNSLFGRCGEKRKKAYNRGSEEVCLSWAITAVGVGLLVVYSVVCCRHVFSYHYYRSSRHGRIVAASLGVASLYLVVD